jgi:hypothetical protein
MQGDVCDDGFRRSVVFQKQVADHDAAGVHFIDCKYFEIARKQSFLEFAETTIAVAPRTILVDTPCDPLNVPGINIGGKRLEFVKRTAETETLEYALAYSAR